MVLVGGWVSLVGGWVSLRVGGSGGLIVLTSEGSGLFYFWWVGVCYFIF